MNALIEFLHRIFSGWKFWIVIPPWDTAVRVRLGKHAAQLGPGFHFRLPFVDELVIVNTRLRVQTSPVQTLPASGPGGKVRCVALSVGFRVQAPLKAMLSFASIEGALLARAQSALAEGLTTPAILSVLQSEFAPSGVLVEFLYPISDVEVRSLRLLTGNGSEGVWSGASNSPPGVPTY